MLKTGRVSWGISPREPTRAAATTFADNRDGRSYAMHSTAPSANARMVREDVARYSAYESESSDRRSLGSIPVGPDARWTATLTVPIPPRDVAFLQVERRGELPAGYRGAEESAFLSLPIGQPTTNTDRPTYYGAHPTTRCGGAALWMPSCTSPA